MGLSPKAKEILARLEKELKDEEGINSLSKLLDEFVRENLPLIWTKLEEGIKYPFKASPLLLKLIDKAVASPMAMKIKAEGFKLEVVHRLEKQEDEQKRQIEAVEVVRDNGERLLR